MSEPDHSGSRRGTRHDRREQRHLSRTERVRRRYARLSDDYALVLVLIVLTLLATSLFGLKGRDSPLELVLLVVTLIVTLQASHTSERVMRRVMMVLFPLVLVVAVATEVGATRTTVAITLGVSAALAIVAPIVILRRLVHHAAITLRTILGALCVYLLIGYFFSVLYVFINNLAADGFFAQGKAAATPTNFIYFTYVTLTTVGFGDLSPAGDTGKILVITEALLGQLYLVTIVALLVGNIGRVRGRGDTSEVAGTTADDDAGASGEAG